MNTDATRAGYGPPPRGSVTWAFLNLRLTSTSGSSRHTWVVTKKIVLFALWVVGSLVAIAVVSQGVRLIDDQVSAEEAPIDVAASVSGTPNQDALTKPTTTTSPVSPASTTTMSVPSLPTVTTAPPGTASTPATTPVIVAPSTVAATPTSPTAAPAPPTTAATVPAPAPTTTAAPVAQVLTFNLVGGSTAISFSPTEVFAVWATPNSGFTVEIKPHTGGSTTVEFRSDDHRSRIDARWDGQPVHDIEEDD